MQLDAQVVWSGIHILRLALLAGKHKHGKRNGAVLWAQWGIGPGTHRAGQPMHSTLADAFLRFTVFSFLRTNVVIQCLSIRLFSLQHLPLFTFFAISQNRKFMVRGLIVDQTQSPQHECLMHVCWTNILTRVSPLTSLYAEPMAYSFSFQFLLIKMLLTINKIARIIPW